MYKRKFQITIKAIVIIFDIKGYILKTSELKYMKTFEKDMLNKKRRKYNVACLAIFPFDLKDQNLFKRKLSQKIVPRAIVLAMSSLNFKDKKRKAKKPYSDTKDTKPTIRYFKNCSLEVLSRSDFTFFNTTSFFKK